MFRLDVQPRFESGFLIVRCIIESQFGHIAESPVARLQVLQHQISQWPSSWIPFQEQAILPNEQPSYWNEPVAIEITRIHPGEVIVVEHIFMLGLAPIIHIGLQVRLRSGREQTGWQQTTTRFCVLPGWGE